MHSSALFFTLTCDNGDVMILLLFLEPNDESGANVDASVSCLYELHCLIAHVYLCTHDNVSPVCVWLQKMWRDNRKQFNDIAQSLVRKSLGL